MTRHSREVSASSVHPRTEPSIGLVLVLLVGPIQRILAVQPAHADRYLRLHGAQLLHLPGDMQRRLAVQLVRADQPPRLPGVWLLQRLAGRTVRVGQLLRLLGALLRRHRAVQLQPLHGVQHAHVDSLQRHSAVQLVRGAHQRLAVLLLRGSPSLTNNVSRL